MISRTQLLPVILLSLCWAGLAPAQKPVFAKPHARILQDIDDYDVVTLRGNVHPMAAAARSAAIADDTPMEHMILFLKGDTTQEDQLAQLIAKQHDPNSSSYHQFLTPAEFGSEFGVAQSDIEKVTLWLQDHGFTIDRLPAGSRAIVFSGTASQVAEAFGTEIRQYQTGGVTHYANATDPQIPAALAATVGGIVKLHNFRHGHSITNPALVTDAQLANPASTSGSSHYLAPADYSTLYNISPLYSAGIDGTGQTIAVIARSNVSLSDVRSFRSSFGLKANDPQIVITNTNPGVVQGDNVETTLDTEWSGAVAPNATVKVIVAASTNTADGIDLASLYAVNNNVAPVITLSYGSCEAGMGSSELAFYNSLWKQAAAQGQSVFVSSGDSGAAGCSGGSSSSGSGQAINGLCSSAYSTCVGGTQFADSSNPGQYWQPGNNTTYGSAISYIPEAAWNESGSNGGSGLWAGGGGASITYAKPSWQTSTGVPADGRRDVPDVSLTAAGHDGYLIFLYGTLYSVGGTSAAAPSFAGMMALVDQKANARQGLANSILYPLAAKQNAGGAAIFHDIKAGNNSVPGVTGFAATTGYDLATGLGSVDANLLVTHWADGSAPAASIALAASSTSVTLELGKSAQTTVTSTATSINAPVSLTVTGMPAGVTATFSSSSIASPGSGSIALTITAASTAKAGTYPLTVTASGGGKTATLAVSVVIPSPTFTLASSASSASVLAGNTAQFSLSSTPQHGFTSTVSFSVTGMPAGVTTSFSPATLTGGAAGSSTATLAVAKTVAAGTYALKINATGGGITQTVTFSLTVTVPASCTLAASPTSATVFVGGSTSVQISCGTVKGTFTGPLTIAVSGAPAGVTAKTATASLAAGAATSLSINALSTTAPGSYKLSISATGSGGFSQTLSLPLTVPVPTFVFAATATTANDLLGTSSKVSFTITPQNGFSSTVGLSVSGLPAGVTALFSPASVSGAAAASSTLTLAVGQNAKGGTYPLTVTATGGGVTRTVAFSLVVTLPPMCSLTANPNALSLTAGQAGAATISCPVTQGKFTTTLALSLSGVPSGLTATAAASVLTPGSATTLNISTSVTNSPGSYHIALTASGSGYTQTLSLPVTVSAANTFVVQTALPSLTIKNGTTGQLNVSSLGYGVFNSAVSFGFSGLPAGVAATFASSGVVAGGSGTVTAAFSAASTAKAGSYPITVIGTGGGQAHTAIFTLVVSSAPGFTLAVNTSTLSLPQGGSGSIIVSTGGFTGGFNSTITITFSGIASGMNWAVKGATTANNMVNITDSFSAATFTPAGTYPVTITASGGGVSHSAVVQMTVTSSTQVKR